VFLSDVLEWLQRPADTQSPQSPSALTKTGQRAQLSRLPALCRDYIQPYQQHTGPTHQICWLGPHEIIQSPPSGQNRFGLRTPGVYKILCECGRVYIGQTGRSVDIRLKEHQRQIRLEHPDKSALDEHSIDHGHRIQLHNSFILATKTRYMDRIVREACIGC
jgi:hypothetical protein